jgi:hypothetical protein
MRFLLSRIPAGERGTDVTVGKIIDHVHASLRRPVVRLSAIGILNSAQVQNKNTPAAVAALYRYVSRNIRYIPDPLDVETIQDPEATLKIRAGDCDDHATVLAALAASIGVPVRFRVIGPSADNFQHIFPELYVSGRWIPADTTEAKQLGVRPRKFPAEKVYPLNGSAYMQMSGSVSVPLNVGTVQAVAYRSTMKTLESNWNNGLINLADVNSYLRVIDEGNSPSKGTVVEPSIRKAIVAFRDHIVKDGIGSRKAPGLSGLEGLDGFLKSIWNGVKKAVGTAVNVAAAVVPGGQAAKKILTTAWDAAKQVVAKKTQPIINSAEQALIENQTAIPAESQAAGYAAAKEIGDYLPWIIGGLVAIIVLPKVLKGR